jgi:hypothetical protein
MVIVTKYMAESYHDYLKSQSLFRILIETCFAHCWLEQWGTGSLKVGADHELGLNNLAGRTVNIT